MYCEPKSKENMSGHNSSSLLWKPEYTEVTPSMKQNCTCLNDDLFLRIAQLKLASLDLKDMTDGACIAIRIIQQLQDSD